MNAHVRILFRLTKGTRWIGGGLLFVFVNQFHLGLCFAQENRCDPTKVMTAESCAKCHANEVRVWQQTPHFETFESLSRRPKAKDICSRMGLRSVKRSDVCTKCHFTLRDEGDKIKAVSGISCESCHGAAEDWIQVHNDYGPTATRETESDDHAWQRFDESTALGMRNTRDLYSIASSCLNCHTVPDEQLVNVGGHNAGTEEFDLVRYSQGKVRHNFLRNDGDSNTSSPPERLRLMYVVGLMADLEYSTRATAQATEKSTFGLKSANRAARRAVKLYEVQQKINDAHVQNALQAFASAELKTNNYDLLTQVADQIRESGMAFAEETDGANLEAVDAFLPSPSTYK